MSLLKIKMKELIFLVFISVIVGLSLYYENYDKIVYTVQAERGYIINKNYCNTHNIVKLPLINQSDFFRLTSQNYFKSLDFRTSFKINNNSDTYEITFKGRLGQEAQMYEQSIFFFDLLSKLEISIFKKDYEQATLHCNYKSFKAFNLIPTKVIDSKSFAKSRYKKYFEIVIAFIPLLIFYLGFLAFKFIKKMS